MRTCLLTFFAFDAVAVQTTPFLTQVLLTPLRYIGMLRRRQLLADAADGENVQKELLKELLHRHQFTQYGRTEGLRLRDVDCWSTFRKRHPITSFSHYEPYIARIRRGELDILAAGKPLLLAMTSAAWTSGAEFDRKADPCSACPVLNRSFPEI